MVRFRFNTQRTPPAPFVHVRLANPGDPLSIVENVPALIDTGADCTMVPVHLIENLRTEMTGVRWIQGVGSKPTQEATYAVRLNFRTQAEQHLLNVVASETEPFPLLGRDLLNNYRILLDGPTQLVDIA